MHHRLLPVLLPVLFSVACASDSSGDAKPETETETETETENRAPTVSVRISPSAEAMLLDTLTGTAEVVDEDGDSLDTAFSWTVDGAETAATSSADLTSTLADAFGVGQEVGCIATVDDGNGETAAASASVTIENSGPAVDEVTLDKSVVYTDETLTASVSASDAEGDALTITYDWYVAGASVQSGEDDTLDGASMSAGFDKGDEVYVVVSVTDGVDTTSSTSSTLTVSNALPGAPVVSIEPSAPAPGDVLTCVVTTDSEDADEDVVSYAMSWTVDGVLYEAGAWTVPTTTTWTDDTVSGSDTLGLGLWECTATPNDGEEDGSPGTASLEIEPCLELLEDMPSGSLTSTWTDVGDVGPNPVVSWSEVSGGYDSTDGTVALYAECTGTTYGYCETKNVSREFPVDTLLASDAAVEFFYSCTSTQTTYNAASVGITLYDSTGTAVSSGSFSDPACFGSWYTSAELQPFDTNADPLLKRVELDRLSGGGAIEFDSVRVSLQSYACVGTNESTLDHILLDTCP